MPLSLKSAPTCRIGTDRQEKVPWPVAKAWFVVRIQPVDATLKAVELTKWLVQPDFPRTGLTGSNAFHPGDCFLVTSRANATNTNTTPVKDGTSIAVMESFCAAVRPFQNCLKCPARA